MLHGPRLTAPAILARSGALDRLRAGTAAAHAALEDAFDWRGRLSTLAGYGGTLAALHGFHLAWEPQVAAALDEPAFFEPRRRAALLADDLRHLGLPAKASMPPGLPSLRTEAAAWGSLYVVEGSRLGGRLIARHVAAVLGLRPRAGLSYYAGPARPGQPEAGVLWRALCTRLDERLRSDADLDQAVAAATATFGCMGACLTGPLQ